jgi:hypothetical protein
MSWSKGLRNLGACAKCNPKSSGECGFGSACRVTGATSEPTCAPAGTKQQDEACTSAADCAPGLICGCGGADAGTFGIGDQCASGGGACRLPCADWSRGQTWDCPNNMLCVGEGDGLYSYCRPQ